MNNRKTKDPLKDVESIDYKDIELLKRFLNPHGKIVSRRRTRISGQDQRRVTKAVKQARFMGLLPYTFK